MSLQNFIHNDPVQAQLQYAILLSCSIDERRCGEMSMALGKCFIGFDDDVRCSLYATDVIYRHHAHRIQLCQPRAAAPQQWPLRPWPYRV